MYDNVLTLYSCEFVFTLFISKKTPFAEIALQPICHTEIEPNRPPLDT